MCLVVICVIVVDRDVASVFGEQRKLEPMSPDRKLRWKKEIDWLLSVTEHIVELVPSKQAAKDGTTMEVFCRSLNYCFKNRMLIV